MMDHPNDEKLESQDTIQDQRMKSLDNTTMKKNKVLESEKVDESMEEVRSDNEETVKDQVTDMQSISKMKKDSTDAVKIQICLTDTKIEKNQCSEIKNIGMEEIQVIETQITEETEIQIETERIQKPIYMKSNNKYDSSNKSILKSTEDTGKIVTENVFAADSTTDANNIIIDLCDDDQIDLYEKKDSGNIQAGNISLNRHIECDSNNKTTPENMDNTKKEEENVPITNNNNIKKKDNIIIGLLCHDKTEMYELKDGGNHTDRWDTSSQIERGNVFRSIPSSVINEQNEKSENTLPIQIVESIISDDSESETEIETRTMKDITKVGLEICEITDQNDHEDLCKLTNEETCQMTGKDASEEPSKTQLTCHPEGAYSYNSNAEKDVILTRNEDNYQGCFFKVSVNNEETSEALLIKSKSDENEIKKSNKEYEIENVQLKEDIITVQEDSMDSKQISNESSYNLEKSETVFNDDKFAILDKNALEENKCYASEESSGCGHEDETGTNTRISEIPQYISNFEEQETISELKREEKESRKLIEQDEDLKPGVDELKESTLILAKKEIENNLKHFGGFNKQGNKPSIIEKGENISIQSETIHREIQHEENIQSESTNLLIKVKESRLLENNNQVSALADIKNEPEKEEKSTGTNNGGNILCNKNVQLIINLDTVKSKRNDDSFTENLQGIPGCDVKGGDLKVFQTESTEDAHYNPANAYLSETPPSHSESNEYFDAVEYIPEETTTEISLTIKPSMLLLSTPCLNLINEPIPGPSGISTVKNRAETPVEKSGEETDDDFFEATEFSSDEDTKFPEVEQKSPTEMSSPRGDVLKLKECRKHDGMEDEYENENKKKIKLD